MQGRPRDSNSKHWPRVCHPGLCRRGPRPANATQPSPPGHERRLGTALHGEDLAQAYASADPSTTDTFGNVVLGALASGLPVAHRSFDASFLELWDMHRSAAH